MAESGQDKMDVDPVAMRLNQLKIVEKPSPGITVLPAAEDGDKSQSSPDPNASGDGPNVFPATTTTKLESEAPVAVAPTTTSIESLPTVLIIIGMAGSGKTTLTTKIISYLLNTGQVPYVVNLDPACRDPPYGVNIDIRDTVDYKQVMKGNGLGPNGAIVTSLNLFATKFDTVLDILKNRKSSTKYIVIDTPGQIEVFMWSASGSIITELLASNFPTIMVYVTDLFATKSPISFMSNMSYACSILYKTKLPLVIALNKCDLESADTVKSWITDLEAFQLALQNHKGFSVNLASSLSLVLDDFYENIQHTPVSAVTGEGIPEFIKSLEAAVVEYKTIYKVHLEKMIAKNKAAKLAMPRSGSSKGKGKKSAVDPSSSYVFSMPATSDDGLGLNLTLDDDSDEPESEEEDPYDAMEEQEEEETIGQVFKRESDRRLQQATGTSQPNPSSSKLP